MNEDQSEYSVLEEKDFIQEVKGKDPIPLWLFVLIVLSIFFILWAGGNWFLGEMQERVEESPFLQVTNRQISLFLWQNPEYMRIHASSKTGYLPGFHSVGKVNPRLESIDETAVAPPEVLFRYHTWDRLLGDTLIKRPIPPLEFQAFLTESPEWHPLNWPDAPSEYLQFVEEFDLMKEDDLQSLPEDVLPNEVRMAFTGWKNYYQEGELINQIEPTAKQMRQFLEGYPEYERHNWRNLFPDYFKSLDEKKDDDVIPKDELTSFLRVALFNQQQQSPPQPLGSPSQ